MGRRLLIAGHLNPIQEKAIRQAAAYKGNEPAIEQYHDCVIKHKVGGKTIIAPVGVSAFVGVALPNPVPNQALLYDVTSYIDSDGRENYYVVVYTSNTETLARETVRIYSGEYWTGYSNQTTLWSGGEQIAIFHRDMLSNLDFQHPPAPVYDHMLTFDAPDDCVYEMISDPPYPGDMLMPQSTVDALNASWRDEFRVGTARRRTRFRKNSDVTLTAAVVSGALIAKWDYYLKSSAPSSGYTYQEQKISVFLKSETVNDTTNGLINPGTKLTERVYVLSFETIAHIGGVAMPIVVEEEISSRLEQVVIRHYMGGVPMELSRKSTFTNWLVDYGESIDLWPLTILRIAHQFIPDEKISLGAGLIWNGVEQRGYFKDSEFDIGFAGSGSDVENALRIPPYPSYYNTLAGTAPDVVLDYYRENKPSYAEGYVASDRTDWLVSSLMSGMTVTLIPFGPVIKTEDVLEGCGMFAHQYDVDQAVMVEIYGYAVFTYHDTDGSFTFSSWNSLKYAADDDETASVELGYRVLRDTNGDKIQIPDSNGDMHDFRSRFINLPAATWPAYNCIIRYGNLEWPDTIATAKASAKERAAGGGDQFMHAILRAINTPLRRAQ